MELSNLVVDLVADFGGKVPGLKSVTRILIKNRTVS